MKPTKLTLLLFLLIVTLSTVRSQDLINLIPKEFNYVGMIDINQINTKAKFSELTKLPFLESIAEGLVRNFFKDSIKENNIEYLNLSKYGISSTGKFYFYYTNKDNVNYGVLLVNLTNEAEFKRFAKLATFDTTGSPIVVKNNCNYASKKGFKIVWNNKQAALMSASIASIYKDPITKMLSDKYYESKSPIVVDTVSSVYTEPVEESISEMPVTDETVTPVPAQDYFSNDTLAVVDTTGSNYNYNYQSNYDDSYSKIYNASDSICDSYVEKWCTSNFDKFLSDKGANSLASNQHFADLVKSKPDAAFMFDYEQFFKQYAGSVLGFSALRTMKNLPFGDVMDWYKGTEVLAKVELNKDDVQVSLDMKYGDKLGQVYKEIKKKKISPNFLKYMDKNLMGYCAMGFDIKGIAKGTGNMLKSALPAIPKYGNLAVSALEVLDIMIDEQSIYNLLTGDMVLAVNGVKPVQVIHKTYKYDDNFNGTEIMDTMIQNQPEVLFMLGVGNAIDVNKIIKLLVNTEALKQEGAVYSFSKGSSAFPFYLTLQDNILFMSNSKSYIQNPVVYEADKQLGKEHSKMFASYTTVSFVNIAKITEYYAKDTTNKFQSVFSDATRQVSDIKYCGGNNNGYSNSRVILKLKETNDNSIVDIIKFLDALYLSNKKSQRYE